MIKCNKVCYYSIADAMHALNYRKFGGIFSKIYFCPTCHSHHITKDYTKIKKGYTFNYNGTPHVIVSKSKSPIQSYNHKIVQFGEYYIEIKDIKMRN